MDRIECVRMHAQESGNQLLNGKVAMEEANSIFETLTLSERVEWQKVFAVTSATAFKLRKEACCG